MHASTKLHRAGAHRQRLFVSCDAAAGAEGMSDASRDAPTTAASELPTPSTSGVSAEPAVASTKPGKGLRLRARLRLLARTRTARIATAPARYVASLPAMVEQRRIAKLKIAAEAAPDDVQKNDAYLAALVQRRCANLDRRGMNSARHRSNRTKRMWKLLLNRALFSSRLVFRSPQEVIRTFEAGQGAVGSVSPSWFAACSQTARAKSTL